MSVKATLIKNTTLIRNVHIIDPQNNLDQMGVLRFDDQGVITYVGADKDVSQSKNVTVIDGQGHVLAPGLIDSRVNLTSQPTRGSIKGLGEAANRGGITTIICHPGFVPPIDRPSVVFSLREQFKPFSNINAYFIGALTQNLEGKTLSEMGMLADAGVIGYGDGIQPQTNVDVLYRAFRYARSFDLPIVQRPDEHKLSENGDMNGGLIASKLGLKSIPWIAEILGLERDIRIASAMGIILHTGPVSLGASVHALRLARTSNKKISAETCPHYFLLDETAVEPYRTFAKVLPPLRAKDEKQAIQVGLREGVVDIISSDHTPRDEESKRQPYPAASFGVAGVETLLAASLELVHNNVMTLSDMLHTMTAAPAKLFNLDGLGALNIGNAADLVLFDPNEEWAVNSDDLHSSARNTAFDEHQFRGRVKMTFKNGELIYNSIEH